MTTVPTFTRGDTENGISGVPFLIDHPQTESHTQLLRDDFTTVPTLLGKLFFVKSDSDDLTKRDNYYCIIAGLFFPWSENQSPKDSNQTWENFVKTNEHLLSPRLRRLIYNLSLLHKSKEDSQVHQMHFRAQEEKHLAKSITSVDCDDDVSTIASDDCDSSFDEMIIKIHNRYSQPISKNLRQILSSSIFILVKVLMPGSPTTMLMLSLH